MKKNTKSTLRRLVIPAAFALALATHAHAATVTTQFWSSDFEGQESWTNTTDFYSPIIPAAFSYGGASFTGWNEWAANGGKPQGLYQGPNARNSAENKGFALAFNATSIGAHTEGVWIAFSKTVEFSDIATPQAIAAGDTFTLGGWLKFSADWDADTDVQNIYLAIRQRDAGGNEVAYSDQGITSVQDYAEFTKSVSVVANATKVELVISYTGFGNNTSAGIVWADDMYATVSQTTAIPEPATWTGLAGLVILTAAVWRRRRI